MPDRPRETASERAERLYGGLGADLYRYAVMLLADPASAEDAIQQVFAALLRHSGDLQNDAHYMRRAVRNECYSMLRGGVRRKEEPGRPLLDALASEGVNHAERLALEDAIRELPAEQREVAHLHGSRGSRDQRTWRRGRSGETRRQDPGRVNSSEVAVRLKADTTRYGVESSFSTTRRLAASSS